MHRLGRLVTRRPRRILIVAGFAVVLAALAGVRAPGKLLPGGFVSPNAPSQQATNRLDAHFGGSPNLILLVTARHGNVNSPGVSAAGKALAARLAAAPGIKDVRSYWSTGDPSLRSRSGTEALVVGGVIGSDKQVADRSKTLVNEFSVSGSQPGPVTVQAGGSAGAGNAIGNQIGKDLALAEGIAIPVTMALLILAFGSVVAAALPIVIGLLAIMGSLAALFLLASVTSVSQYALNLTTALGLALAIDYSLLMVNRYREELAGGLAPADAVRQAVARAGRTILFSAATVAAAMAALLVFPVYFLRSFAYAGVSVVVVATAGALLVLPALLAVLGPRVNALAVRGASSRMLTGAESPFWRRTANAVMRNPVAAGLPIVLALVALAIPFRHVHFGTPDDRVLPTSAAARQVGDALRTQFSSDAGDTIDVVTATPLTATDTTQYSREISGLHGVVNVRSYQSAAATWLSAVITPDAESRAAQTLVHQVRALPVPGGARSYVGGNAASLVDQKDDLRGSLPLGIGLIALVTFLVLWLFTGSVILPLKALVLNVLSLTAVFGVIVWVFQDGHLSWLLGFTPTPTSTTMPLLLACIAFGLSMDYEVFVLSRIKELHDAGASNREAVAGGLARTGRIVSTAAALMAVTFFAFATSKVSFIQMFGLGTGVAIVVDATLIRGVLVPAFMRLAGDLNWWAPTGLRRLHARIGFSELPPPVPA